MTIYIIHIWIYKKKELCLKKTSAPNFFKTIITFIGDGWVSNLDGTNQQSFTQIKFKILQDKDTQLDYEDCFYWEEIERFKNVFNEIIK